MAVVLVTGAGGALGGATVRLLAERGHRVVACGRRRSPATPAAWDVARMAAPRLAAGTPAPQVVVHAAAATGGYGAAADVATLLATNFEGSRRVGRWCREAGVEHLVLISGALVYGCWERPRREEDRPRPWRAGFYAVSKWLGELAVAGLEGPGTSILRLSSLYGAAYDDGLPQRLLRRGRRRGEIAVDHPPDDAFDLLHLRDAARTVAAAVERRRPGTWNAGGGGLVTVAELAAGIARHLGCPVVHRPAAEPRRRRILNWVDDRRARTELGHRNAVSLDAGLAEIVAGGC
ncbi:MAG: NAD(P)-dependent oxidoreductase [Acidobacteria bacterium]|nr:MAG: NAD(P)-dependent oxidoreductase [Acidobacteriota bacterium]